MCVCVCVAALETISIQESNISINFLVILICRKFILICNT